MFSINTHIYTVNLKIIFILKLFGNNCHSAITLQFVFCGPGDLPVDNPGCLM